MKNVLLWNVLSALFIALTAFLINTIIGSYFDSSVVGTFNQAAALYILFSYICNFGIHSYILYRTSVVTSQSESHLIGPILFAALISILIMATPLIFISYFIIKYADTFFSSNGMLIQTWIYLMPALLFYAFNRTLLNAINGLGHLHLLAFFLMLRHIFIISTLIFLIYLNVFHSKLTLVFTGAELLLFICLFANFFRSFKQDSIFSNLLKKIKETLSFSSKAVLGTLASELNGRVDLLFLSYFTSPQVVGEYAMAALAFEGTSQILIAIRNIINPKITQNLMGMSSQDFKAFVQNLVLKISLGTLIISLLLMFIYPYFVHEVLKDASYIHGYFPLIILLSGLTVTSGFFVLDMIFIQSGSPSTQTLFKTSVFGFNLIMNMLLVPSFKLMGAAMAVCSTLCFSAFLLRMLCKKHLSL